VSAVVSVSTLSVAFAVAAVDITSVFADEELGSVFSGSSSGILTE
jgi:hypothetical protein